MQQLSIALAQRSIVWGDPRSNLQQMADDVAQAAHEGYQLIVFPEVMLTGFDLNMSRSAQPWQGEVLEAVRALAVEHQIALATSAFVQEGGCYYNRACFVHPDGSIDSQDKRHLFSMAGEDRTLTPGGERRIIEYRGWRILLLTCYDLRFPVWCRNQGLEYDLLIVVANWPTPRVAAWDALLVARAIENIAYVVGVNRTGSDPHGIAYSGHSALYSYLGHPLVSIQPDVSVLAGGIIEREPLERFRTKFPVWRDADSFTIRI